jgi:F0F1-type ATP synthase delta subunit
MKINPKLKKDLKSFLLNNIQKEQNRALVISADNLSLDQKKILQQKFSDLNWKEAIYKTDKSVIAGIVIKVGSKIIDLSLTGLLSKLSNTLYEID